MLEGVVCSGRAAQVFPDTAAGTVSGRAAYQFQNTSGQEQTVAFGVNPGYDDLLLCGPTAGTSRFL
ncbi:MAG: hypothetical protein ACLSE4_15710 [Clostridium sp.]